MVEKMIGGCNKQNEFLITLTDTAKEKDVQRLIEMIKSNDGVILEVFETFKIVMAHLPDKLLSRHAAYFT